MPILGRKVFFPTQVCCLETVIRQTHINECYHMGQAIIVKKNHTNWEDSQPTFERNDPQFWMSWPTIPDPIHHLACHFPYKIDKTWFFPMFGSRNGIWSTNGCFTLEVRLTLRLCPPFWLRDLNLYAQVLHFVHHVTYFPRYSLLSHYHPHSILYKVSCAWWM